MRLDILKKAVDKKFGLDIATRSRKRKYVYPRKVFCKLARDTRVTFREIGKEINTQHVSKHLYPLHSLTQFTLNL